MRGMPLTLLIACALLQAPPAAGQAPEAPPAASPGGTAPAAAPAVAPASAPGTPPAAVTEPASGTPAPAGSEPPRQVWLFVDRWKEFGGTVVHEDHDEIVVVGPLGERREYNKTKLLDIVDIVRPAPGQRGLIQLRDGSIVRGEILKDSLEEVEFRVDTVVGRLPREKVYRVVLEQDFDTRYRRLKDSIAPEEHGRRIALARWLAEQDRLDLAQQELEALLRDADSETARDVLREVKARAELKRSIEESRRKGNAATGGGTEAGPDAAAPGREGSAAPAGPGDRTPSNRDLRPSKLVSDEDVNIVRVYEIDFKDPPRLKVDPEGIRQLVLRYGSSDLIPASAEQRNLLFSKPDAEIARLMFDLRARDLYKFITVSEDPASLARFRTRVHNSWLLTNCATSRCHGGVQAGRFFLHTGESTDVRIRYTNLLTLLEFEVDGKRLVDFEDPPDSLLVQYATQRNLARYPHPDVKGWKPVFSKSTPQLMSETLEWIRGMHQPRPEYPVDFELPKLDAPDRPVRRPDEPDR